MIPASVHRRFADLGHRPPTGKHRLGREQSATWQSTSRIIDRPARRKANRRSWLRHLARARQRAVAAANERAATRDLLARAERLANGAGHDD